MYLVGNDKDSVPVAYLSHLFQFFLAPYVPRRIMGITEQEHLYLWLGTMLLKTLKTYGYRFEYTVVVAYA